jgi:hypothetical protein
MSRVTSVAPPAKPHTPTLMIASATISSIIVTPRRHSTPIPRLLITSILA